MNMRYFDLAKKISGLSDHPRFKLGAVIVRKNKILGLGVNKIKTHPKADMHPYNMLHAEINAILKSKQDLHDCEIYVYRETKAGVPALSKPCVYCLPLIRESGINKIHYSINGSYRTAQVI